MCHNKYENVQAGTNCLERVKDLAATESADWYTFLQL